MWIFGHAGIGFRIARPFSRGLPIRSLLLGTLTPDLIDKPLYFIAASITGKQGAEIGLISCTRTFGHSGLLTVGILSLAFFSRSRGLAALALGMATHLLLDGLQDAVGIGLLGYSPPSSTLLAALYPFYVPHFADYPFRDVREHVGTLGNPLIWVAEIFGALILYRDVWRPWNIARRGFSHLGDS